MPAREELRTPTSANKNNDDSALNSRLHGFGPHLAGLRRRCAVSRSLCSCGLLTYCRQSKSQVRAAAPMRDFLQQLQADLPCPVPTAKIIRFARDPNHPYNSRHPVPVEGRWPSSRTLGRDAVDAAASGAWSCWQGGPKVRERTQRVDDWRGCVRQSRVVLAPVAGVKLAEERRPNRVSAILQSAGDGGKRNSSPGRARYKPSNHCAGNAGVLQLYLYARVRTHRTYCTRDRGCSKHPAFPAPSSLMGE